MSGVILQNTRDPLYGFGVEELEKTIADRIAGRAASAWVFGSLARGDYRRDSDIDLIIVVDTDLPFTRRQALFDDLYELFPALDLLVYTPDEFASLTGQPSAGFWSDVVSTMRRLM